MRELIEKHTIGSAGDGEALEEANYDHKAVYDALRKALKSLGVARSILKPIPASKWGKANIEEAMSLDALMVKLNQVVRDGSNLAVGIGVMAGR